MKCTPLARAAMETGASLLGGVLCLLLSGMKRSCSLSRTFNFFSVSVSPCLRRDLGRNQKGIPANSITTPVIKKPSHQAPTQRESLWLMVMISSEK